MQISTLLPAGAGLLPEDWEAFAQVSVECKKQWYQAPYSLAQKWVCRVREGMSLFGQLQRLTHNSQLFIVMDNTTSGEIITS